MALRAEMGDLLPESVVAYARELRRATRRLNDVQRARADARLQCLRVGTDRYRPRVLLGVALDAAMPEDH